MTTLKMFKMCDTMCRRRLFMQCDADIDSLRNNILKNPNKCQCENHMHAAICFKGEGQCVQCD